MANNLIVKPNKISIIDKWKLKRKIAVPDIKQYLVDEFTIIKDLEKEIREKTKNINELELIKQKYEMSLVTLKEYKERLTSKDETIKELNKIISEKQQNVEYWQDMYNTTKLNNNTMEKKINELVDERNKLSNIVIHDYKDRLFKSVSDIKGHLSKDKVIETIDNTK